jgi:AcrR family transcriptional regulator
MPALAPRKAVRKQPSQERSRSTVEAILAATVRLLRKEGFEGITTNRVALIAGVSIGSLYQSLYQYFPSKEAVVNAVFERHCEEVMQLLEGKLSGLLESPVEVAIPAMVQEFLAMHRLDPKLHKALLAHGRAHRHSHVKQLEQRFAQLVSQYLRAHAQEVEVKDHDLAAYLLVTAIDALAHDVIENRGELLEHAELEAQLSRLALGYLAPRQRRSIRAF